MASEADLVFHLAGVNRPKEEREFSEGNAGLTRQLCSSSRLQEKNSRLVLSSSIQAELDNPYGRSKREAEEAVLEYRASTGAAVYIYRFPNVFGKWSRPNYNTVVATFCHNISRSVPVQVSNRDNVLRFVYIDDIAATFLAIAGRPDFDPSRSTTKSSRSSPSLWANYTTSSCLSAKAGKNRCSPTSPARLHDTYTQLFCLSGSRDFAYPVDLKTDERGWLFELVKSPNAGQIFVSRTHPGITRGNHYHDTKMEKFCVIQGQGVIRFRHVLGSEIIEYPVNDQEIQIVDIPPGYTHSIENTGSEDMITLFWANEIFDPD